jgi:hypothetical protein
MMELVLQLYMRKKPLFKVTVKVGDLQYNIIHPLPRVIRRIFLPFSDFAS